MTRRSAARILLVDCGGTIGEGSPSGGLAAGEILPAGRTRFLDQARVSALADLAPFDYLFLDDAGSPDLAFAQWAGLARRIAQHSESYAGIVVTHGTDTLAWAAATLTFCLVGTRRPIVLTGAMLPLSRPGGDGWANLRNAFRVAARGRVRGVSVVFGSRILHGGRVRKMFQGSPDAFDSPAVPPLGRIGRSIRLAAQARPSRALPAWSGDRGGALDERVALTVVTPGLHEDRLAATVASGIIVETYASGTLPARLMPALERLAADRPVAITVENGRLAAGAWPAYPDFLIRGRDLTREAAVVKLMWALGNAGDRSTVRSVFEASVAGELSLDLY